jgi:hypothetical protein
MTKADAQKIENRIRRAGRLLNEAEAMMRDARFDACDAALQNARGAQIALLRLFQAADKEPSGSGSASASLR